MSAGSYLCSSFLYVNLSCEMIYVLSNRLNAQNIPPEKGQKIISEITNSAFNLKFIQELVHPQQSFTIASLKDILKKLANVSLMKLDSSSMDKLFYLVLMTFKRQVILSSSPLQLHTMTSNHIKIVYQMITNPQIKHKVKQAEQTIINANNSLTYLEYFWIKQELLSTLQPYQTKIVTFIERGYQTDKGQLTYFPRNSHNAKSIGSSINHPELKFNLPIEAIPQRNLPYESFTSWKTQLGINSYKESSSKISSIRKFSPKKLSNRDITSQKQVNDTAHSIVSIMGVKNQQIDDFDFTLDILGGGPTQNSSKPGVQNQKQDMKFIGTTTVTKTKLVNQINKDFQEVEKAEQDNQEVDLLAMMDDQE